MTTSPPQPKGFGKSSPRLQSTRLVANTCTQSSQKNTFLTGVTSNNSKGRGSTTVGGSGAGPSNGNRGSVWQVLGRGGEGPKRSFFTEAVDPRMNVHAIQSRVEDLVKRFDEAMNKEEEYESMVEDFEELEVPRNWKVGDVLFATHNSLVKTGITTERAILTEITQAEQHQPYSDQLTESETRFFQAIQNANANASKMRHVFTKTTNLIKQLQDVDVFAAKNLEIQNQMKDLKSTNDSLYKEKTFVIAQLQEQMKLHREMIISLDEQAQEIKKIHHSLTQKNEENKNFKEEMQMKVGDFQRQYDLSQKIQNDTKEKLNASIANTLTLETKIIEQEKKIQQQREELIQHGFIFQTKSEEVDKTKEKLRENDTSRLKQAEQIDFLKKELATAQTTIKELQQANANATIKASGKKKRQQPDDEFLLVKKKEKNHQLQLEITELNKKLQKAKEFQLKYEKDNCELAQIVREYQIKEDQSQQIVVITQPQETTVNTTSTINGRRGSRRIGVLKKAATITGRRSSTSTCGRSNSFGRKSKNPFTIGGQEEKGQHHFDDDLSTNESEAEEEEQILREEEKDFTEAIEQALSNVFPPPTTPQTNEEQKIDASIALFEDIDNNPLLKAAEVMSLRLISIASSVSPSSLGSSGSQVSLSSDNPTRIDEGTREQTIVEVNKVKKQAALIVKKELATVNLQHAEEMLQLKETFADGLKEYKRLIITQYENRQANLKEKHREKMASLIQIIQDHSKAQLLKKTEEMDRVKGRIKLLYRIISIKDKDQKSPSGSMQETIYDTTSEKNSNTMTDEQVEEENQIRMLLKATVFAMSTTKRRGRAEETIEQLSQSFQKTGTFSSFTSQSNKAAVRKSSMGSIHEEDTYSNTTKSIGVDFCSQVTEENFTIPQHIHFKGGLEDGTSTPECMDEYGVDAIPLISPLGRVQKEDQAKNKLPLFTLSEGIRLSEEVVKEMRLVLPELPASVYYLTPILRQKLLVEMIAFYSHLEDNASNTKAVEEEAISCQQKQPEQETYLTFVGSPRQMVFMRHKAQETFTKRKLQRHQEIVAGDNKGGVKSLPK